MSTIMPRLPKDRPCAYVLPPIDSATIVHPCRSQLPQMGDGLPS